LRSSSHNGSSSIDDFLVKAEAVITLYFGSDASDNRAFELVNKTNQFNLNGKRYSESDWISFCQDPAAFILTASYEDKYGPLGKIAVVMGKTFGRKVHVSSWVMSCRAFSRRIEHQCLKYLFEKLDVDEIVFEYKLTPRNGPIRDFFAEMLGEVNGPAPTVHRASFDAKVPALSHHIVEVANV